MEFWRTRGDMHVSWTQYLRVYRYFIKERSTVFHFCCRILKLPNTNNIEAMLDIL